MFWKLMKIGSFGEKFRFQFSNFSNLIIYVVIFICIGVVSLLFKPLILSLWILMIIVGTMLLIVFSKLLLIYDDGFIVSTLRATSTSMKKLSFKELKNVYVHIGGFRGSNYFTFYYCQNDKELKVSYKIADLNSSTVNALQFLRMQNIQIYVDDENFGEKVFKISKKLFAKKSDKLNIWFYIPLSHE